MISVQVEYEPPINLDDGEGEFKGLTFPPVLNCKPAIGDNIQGWEDGSEEDPLEINTFVVTEVAHLSDGSLYITVLYKPYVEYMWGLCLRYNGNNYA